jgi:hypothetical protein
VSIAGLGLCGEEPLGYANDIFGSAYLLSYLLTYLLTYFMVQNII